MTRDYRDVVIETLADELADLRECAAGHRELALAGIHALHKLTADHERLRRQHHELLNEYRGLRSRIMRTETAA